MHPSRRILVESSRVLTTYHSFLTALMGAVSIGTNGRNAGSRVAVQVVHNEANRIVDLMGAIIDADIRAVFVNVVNMAMDDVAENQAVSTRETFYSIISEGMQSFHDNWQESLVKDIHEQIRKDARVIVERYQDMVFRARLRAMNRGIDVEDALIAGSIRGKRHFLFEDRAGKRWKSERFIQIKLNQMLFKAYRETYMLGLVTKMQSEAMVNHPEAGNMERFSISGDSANLPSYQQMIEKYFHPGSIAIVKGAGKQVTTKV